MGVIGSLTAGKVLDKTGKYVMLLRFVTVAAFTLCGVVLITLALKLPFGLLLLFVAVMGFSLVPIVTVSYALSVELTHPISPPLANGLMVGGGQLWATILSLALGPVADVSPIGAIGVLLFSCGLSAFLAFFVQEDIKRTK